MTDFNLPHDPYVTGEVSRFEFRKDIGSRK